MEYKVLDSKLIIALSGRVDSSNAEAVGSEINDIRAKNPHSALELDFETLEYLSSAGLRILLRLKKAETEFCVVNVSPEVYDILEMTGFSEIIDVKKAYRQISVDGCDIIGKGSNGIVYRYTDDIVVKVYKNSDALQEIHRERELARSALIMGVNTAIPYDVVKVGDKYGSVFELLSSKSLSKLIAGDPDHYETYSRIFANMLLDIHHTKVDKGILPQVKDTYLDYAEFLKGILDDARYQKLHDLIEAVPASDYMIHGDYHTNNVHYANNEAILIDMDTLAIGNPVFEFASIWLAYIGFDILAPGSIFGFLKLDAPLTVQVYEALLKYYFGEEAAAEIPKYQSGIELLGLTRLLRRTIRRYPDNTDGIQLLKSKLEALIDQVDTLELPSGQA